MNEQGAVTRRHAIKLGAGFAAAAGAAVFAAEPKQETMTPEKLQDPTSKYPEPPFKAQAQPWPISPAKWIRVPITAKKPIKAPAGLIGRKALITGGDSGVGRAAAIAYAQEGADL